MPTLQNWGSSPLKEPTTKRYFLARGKTTNRRAVCGRSARTVRREGRLVMQLSLPLFDRA